jgi:hypothetical protein
MFIERRVCAALSAVAMAGGALWYIVLRDAGKRKPGG